MELMLHFLLMKTKKNVIYSPETRICSFIVEQFETALLTSQSHKPVFAKSGGTSIPSLENLSIVFAKMAD